MTTPTSDQLAPNVDPLLREYIDARIREAVVAVTRESSLQAMAFGTAAEITQKRLAEIDTFEKTVRGHLGL